MTNVIEATSIRGRIAHQSTKAHIARSEQEFVIVVNGSNYRRERCERTEYVRVSSPIHPIAEAYFEGSATVISCANTSKETISVRGKVFEVDDATVKVRLDSEQMPEWWMEIEFTGLLQ